VSAAPLCTSTILQVCLWLQLLPDNEVWLAFIITTLYKIL
jgi:hypothetical protein